MDREDEAVKVSAGQEVLACSPSDELLNTLDLESGVLLASTVSDALPLVAITVGLLLGVNALLELEPTTCE